jgi:hypothetical protein
MSSPINQGAGSTGDPMYDIINTLCGLPLIGPLFIPFVLMGGVLLFALASVSAIVAIAIVGTILFFLAVIGTIREIGLLMQGGPARRSPSESTDRSEGYS